MSKMQTENRTLATASKTSWEAPARAPAKLFADVSAAMLFTLIAIVSILLAAATIYLFVTNPVTVATAVNEGEISPLVRSLGELLLNALGGLLKYL